MNSNLRRLILFGLVVATIAVLIILSLAQNGLRVLKTGNHSYRLTVALTPAVQAKGLGDRTSLPADQGMLFEFSNSAPRCFWMKDMHFSLDMIWLSSSKKVVYIQPNVSPGTYPETFCPSYPAQYVIELNTGQALASHMHTGQTLNF